MLLIWFGRQILANSFSSLFGLEVCYAKSLCSVKDEKFFLATRHFFFFLQTLLDECCVVGVMMDDFINFWSFGRWWNSKLSILETKYRISFFSFFLFNVERCRRFAQVKVSLKSSTPPAEKNVKSSATLSKLKKLLIPQKILNLKAILFHGNAN